MKYYVLASGSKGNCTVIESAGHFIIIDCGSTQKYLKSCFQKIGLDYLKAEGLLITHDHSDHIKQLNFFASLPIYAACKLGIGEKKINPASSFQIANFTITPVRLSHDSGMCVGFIVEDGQEKLVSITDTGYLPHGLQEMIVDADYYIFESNHDVEMLMNSNRPYYLKQRILSDNGHMDNEYASTMLSKIVGTRTKEIALAHISQQCNTRSKVLEVFKETFERNNLNVDNYRVHALEQFEIFYGGNK